MDKQLGKYATASTFNINLFDYSTGKDFIVPTFEAGDVQISIDGGAFSNIATLPTATGNDVLVSLSIAEMTGKEISILFVDQTGSKVWLDWKLLVETYGDINAKFPNDYSLQTLPPYNYSASGGIASKPDLTSVSEMLGEDLPAGSYPVNSWGWFLQNSNIHSLVGTALAETSSGYLANALSFFFNVAAATKTVNDVGGGTGTADWTTGEKEQIRDVLGVDGDKTTATGGQIQNLVTAAVSDIKSVTDLIPDSGAMTSIAQESDLLALMGSGFVEETDSNQAIRDRGDAAWTTGSGGTAPTVQQIREEMDNNSTIAANVSTLISRLTDIRAGYLDNLSAGGVAQEATLTAQLSLVSAIKGVTDVIPNEGTMTSIAKEATAADIAANLISLMGAGFVEATDSNEAIRARGDSAWTTGSGSDPSAIATAVWNWVNSEGDPAEGIMKLLRALAAGTTGDGGAEYNSKDGTKKRMDATMNANNERESVTVDMT